MKREIQLKPNAFHLHIFHYIKQNSNFIILIVIGFLLHMLVMMPSGSNFCIEDRCGMHFWGIHSHDAMWHLEIAAVSFLKWPFQVPTFAGATLSGYNTLMDLLLYLFSVVGINSFFLLFKIIPIIWFAALTFTTILFLRACRIGRRGIFLGLIIIYFAGHLGYVLQWIVEGSPFEGRQSFSLQSLTAQLNTQFALSLPLILIQLTILKKRLSSIHSIFIMGVCSFLIMGLKFYGGVTSLLIVFIYLFDRLISKRQFILIIRDGAIIGAFFIVSVLLFYNPFEAAESGSIFSLSPFATVHSVIEADDMIYLPNLVNARYFLYEHGWGPKLLIIEIFSAGLYMILNFGVRVIGLMYFLIRAVQKRALSFEYYLFGIVLLLFLANIMLVQKGDWWNTVQFGYYSIFLSNFLLLIFLNDILKKMGKWGILIVSVIIILFLPSNIRVLMDFTDRQTLYISRAELEALDYLKAQPYGVVFNSFAAQKEYSFLDYKTSGYVAAFSNKPLWFAHVGPLKIIGVDVSKREALLDDTLCPLDETVKYIYYVKSHNDSILKRCDNQIIKSFGKMFENKEVIIYENISDF